MAKRFTCPEKECQFAVTATTDDQILAMVRKHSRIRHHRTPGDDEVRRAIDA